MELESISSIVAIQAFIALIVLSVFWLIVAKKTKVENEKLRELLKKIGNQETKALSDEQIYTNAKSYLDEQYEKTKALYEETSQNKVVELDPSAPDFAQLTALRTLFLEAERQNIPAGDITEDGSWDIFKAVFQPVLDAYRSLEDDTTEVKGDDFNSLFDDEHPPADIDVGGEASALLENAQLEIIELRAEVERLNRQALKYQENPTVGIGVEVSQVGDAVEDDSSILAELSDGDSTVVVDTSAANFDDLAFDIEAEGNSEETEPLEVVPLWEEPQTNDPVPAQVPEEEGVGEDETVVAKASLDWIDDDDAPPPRPMSDFEDEPENAEAPPEADVMQEQLAAEQDTGPSKEELKEFRVKAKRAIKKLKGKTKVQKNTIQKLREDLKTIEEQHQEKAQIGVSLEEEVAGKDEKISIIEKMMEESESCVKILEDELEALSDQVERLEADLEREQENKERIEKESEKMVKLLEQKEQDSAKVGEQLATLLENRQRQEEESEALSRMLKQKETELVQMNDQLEHMMSSDNSEESAKALESMESKVAGLNKQLHSMTVMMGHSNHLNNDLQMVLNYAADIVGCEGIKELAEKILILVNKFELEGAVQLHSKNEIVNACDGNEQVPPHEIKLLTEASLEDKYRETPTTLLIATDNLRLLLKDLPKDDDDVRTRLKESLGMAVDLTREEIKQIESEGHVAHQRDVLRKALTDTRVTIKRVNVQLVYQAAEAKNILNMLFQQLGKGLSGAKMSASKRTMVIDSLNETKERFSLLFSSEKDSTFSALMRQLGDENFKREKSKEVGPAGAENGAEASDEKPSDQSPTAE